MKIFKSKMFYFFLGLFLAIAIPGVYAWNSNVSSGDPLTASKWNDLVSKVESLEQESESSIDFFDCEIRLHGRDRDDVDRYSSWVSPQEGETITTRTSPNWGRYLRYMEIQVRCP